QATSVTVPFNVTSFFMSYVAPRPWCAKSGPATTNRATMRTENVSSFFMKLVSCFRFEIYPPCLLTPLAFIGAQINSPAPENSPYQPKNVTLSRGCFFHVFTSDSHGAV